MTKTAAIVLNSSSLLSPIKEDFLLCADGGYFRVVGARKNILVIGDFDSLGVPPTDVPYISCPVDKDYTDGERAVRYAAEQGFRKVVIYGADGGRMDMQLSNLLLLKIAYSLSLEAEISTPTESIFYTEKTLSFSCPIGKRVSIIPIGCDATFLSSCGLKYPLDGLTLTSCDTVGLSNSTTKESFSIELLKGGVLVFIEK